MPPRITHIQIRNYKSIAEAAVDLEPLTLLVGPNGAGKTNFVDALAFAHDCLSDSIERAFKRRGGMREVWRLPDGDAPPLGIRLALRLANDQFADYSFEIAARPGDQFVVTRERCVVRTGAERQAFVAREGQFIEPVAGLRPRISSNRLALFAASAAEEFKPVFDFIANMRFYQIIPHRMRQPQEAAQSDCLKRDGSNAAAVIQRLEAEAPDQHARLCRLLGKVVSGIERVEAQTDAQGLMLKFHQEVGLKQPWAFDARNMSDGTLRTLAVLLAAYQRGRHSFLAIEEPDAAVDPPAAGVIIEVLLDAAQERQLLVTTHSPDMLDFKELTDRQVRVVWMREGRTIISHISESGRESIRQQLYTPGELLRLDELRPDIAAAEEAAEELDLFGPPILS